MSGSEIIQSVESLDSDDESISKPKKAKISEEMGTTTINSSAKGVKASALDSATKSLKRSSNVLPEETTESSSLNKRRKVESNQEAREETQHSKDDIETEKKKKPVKTKRAVLKALLEQMEFYFSDSNLSKDRMLRHLLDESEDGYIPLSQFCNFNKLKSLQNGDVSLKILCKSLASSKFLELSNAGDKVRRRIPFVELDQEEVDKRTIYVEQLPTHASHIWIRKIFSQCGKVCYVSLPVYPSTKEKKGFAFVEFSSAEEAEKACLMLNNPTPLKTEEKPGKFPKGNKFLYRAQKILPANSFKPEEPDSNEENMQTDSKEGQTASPIKKKKKKTKKKLDDSTEKRANTESSEIQEEKKKKKKKKKKQSVSTEVEDQEKIVTEATKSMSQSKAEQIDETPCNEKDGEMKYEVSSELNIEDKLEKKKSKRKKRKKAKTLSEESDRTTEQTESSEVFTSTDVVLDKEDKKLDGEPSSNEVRLSRKERKLLRQEDIRKKKAERESKECVNEKPQETKETIVKESEVQKDVKVGGRERLESFVSESSETDDSSKVFRKRDGSQLTSCLSKSKKQDVVKKVEFDPVPITTEFIERKEIRRRKKQKKEILHLRVLSKKEWLSLRAEYINKQKSHMAALKESLRELRMQESGNSRPMDDNGKKHVDLTIVFGTKRMKPSTDVKLAHLEELKFIPNVIVQWKCSHEMKRSKIKTMFENEIPSDRIAYIEENEEAKSGYIRFKDEASAEEFARLSRASASFSARVLPESQQASYWEKANQDRIAKLSKKKNERGTDRIARKVFERNKAVFHEKGSHIVFDNDDDDEDDNGEKNEKTESSKSSEVPADPTSNLDPESELRVKN